jgi:hypothetical protein
MPSEKLRDCGDEQVRMRSPEPREPVSVSLRAPSARPKRASSAKAARDQRGGRARAELAARTMPAAIASTFFAAPPISTPRTSVV